MSRRSLRLHTPHHEHGSPYASASFSMGMPARREPTSSSRRPQLSVSWSPLQTPCRPSHLHNSSLHSVASDASLLSSMLDESSIQERTVVDSTWGELDRHGAVLVLVSTILSEHSTMLANSTLICSGGRAEDVQVQSSMVNACGDCSHPADRKEVPHLADRPTSGPAAASALYSGGQNQGLSPASSASTIYCRDKSRKGKTGVGVSLWDCVRRAFRRTAASLALLLTLLYKHMLLPPLPLRKQLDHGGVLHWILAMGREALVSALLVLNLGLQVFPGLGSQARHGWENWRRRLAHGGVGKLGHEVLLGWWDPRDVLSSVLPAAGADWREALPLASIPGLAALLRPPPETTTTTSTASSSQSAPSPPEQSTDLQAYTEPPPSPPAPHLPPLPPPPMQEEVDDEEESDKAPLPVPGDPERLQRLEQSLSQLWERVEVSGHQAEQMHGEVLGLYQGLRQQQQLVVVQGQAEPDRGSLEPWLDGLLDDKLVAMRVRLEDDRELRDQTLKQYMAQQKSQASHLAELEQLLQALTAKMEQVQQRQEAVAKATTTLRSTSASRLSTSVGGVNSESHDALRSDVSRLEVALGGVRQDLKGLRGCQDHCDRLDHMEEMIFSRVRAHVREELRALLYGNQLVSLSGADSAEGGGAEDQAALPDSLLQWLAERYVSGANLRASLADLELSILRNISQQLQHLQRGGEPANYTKVDNNNDEDDEDDNNNHRRHQTVTQAVEDSLEAAGVAVTEEQVQLMVNNALRLYSQDRTGLADYALESGGGSILSTRCSETYQTRTALLSLFGLPLWYFSQSPRVVIQPDVHPGNCWAFRGPTGYLVIRLSMKIVPSAFSLEHIPKALAPSGALRSAPRDFTVYGLEDEGQEEGQLLGRYSYEEDGEALQMYAVTEENEQAFQIIEVRILSNWGNPEYTCMYRLRVHGRPSVD
ncbi:hypothetical protein CRUP_030637 [Coryphaenoides rupestris]|nr:hypothetical protein CRUP_030637 [Coryphaenoides rupestris]